jgi:hypothetical protein
MTHRMEISPVRAKARMIYLDNAFWSGRRSYAIAKSKSGLVGHTHANARDIRICCVLDPGRCTVFAAREP